MSSNYFVRHINDTPSASTAPAVPTANNTSANNGVRQYFNADNRAVHSALLANESPSTDCKAFTSDGLYFKRNEDNPETVMVCGMAAAVTATHVVIPNRTSHLGLTVTALGKSCFSNCSRLKTITLPASIEEIGDRAFAGSTLESLVLLTSIEKMGKEAFAGCTNLTTIDMFNSRLETLEEGTFYNCPSLIKVTLPSTLKRIEKSTFENCFNLTSVCLPDGVISLGHRLFYNCKSLKTIKIKDALQDIGNDAFVNCLSLDNISPCEYIQDNLQLLKDTALYKNATYDSHGVKAVLGVVLDVTEPAFKYYQQKLPAAQVIAPYAFLNCTQTTVELPKTIRLLLPNALVQHERVKIMDNGVVKAVDDLAVKINVLYAGSVADWRAVVKLHAEQLYPVCVTCTEKDGGKITFIDYV